MKTKKLLNYKMNDGIEESVLSKKISVICDQTTKNNIT